MRQASSFRRRWALTRPATCSASTSHPEPRTAQPSPSRR